jgi:hypothetical protein
MWWLVEPMGDDDVVIVAVEGLSAAGKTTWCRRHAVDFVAEYVPTGTEPDGTDLAAQAAYWVAVNSQRWDNARRLEQQTGLACVTVILSSCTTAGVSAGSAPRRQSGLRLNWRRAAVRSWPARSALLTWCWCRFLRWRHSSASETPTPPAGAGILTCTPGSVNTYGRGMPVSMRSSRGGSSGNSLSKACRQTFPSLATSDQTSPCLMHLRRGCHPHKPTLVTAVRTPNIPNRIPTVPPARGAWVRRDGSVRTRHR